jgi:hypothetical protein
LKNGVVVLGYNKELTKIEVVDLPQQENYDYIQNKRELWVHGLMKLKYIHDIM